MEQEIYIMIINYYNQSLYMFVHKIFSFSLLLVLFPWINPFECNFNAKLAQVQYPEIQDDRIDAHVHFGRGA
jgi:hypothetical protein